MGIRKIVPITREGFDNAKEHVEKARDTCEGLDSLITQGRLATFAAIDLKDMQRQLAQLVLWAAKAQVGLYSAIRSAEANERTNSAESAAGG